MLNKKSLKISPLLNIPSELSRFLKMVLSSLEQDQKVMCNLKHEWLRDELEEHFEDIEKMSLMLPHLSVRDAYSQHSSYQK